MPTYHLLYNHVNLLTLACSRPQSRPQDSADDLTGDDLHLTTLKAASGLPLSFCIKFIIGCSSHSGTSSPPWFIYHGWHLLSCINSICREERWIISVYPGMSKWFQLLFCVCTQPNICQCVWLCPRLWIKGTTLLQLINSEIGRRKTWVNFQKEAVYDTHTV